MFESRKMKPVKIAQSVRAGESATTAIKVFIEWSTYDYKLRSWLILTITLMGNVILSLFYRRGNRLSAEQTKCRLSYRRGNRLRRENRLSAFPQISMKQG
jgi:hypothetical protein